MCFSEGQSQWAGATAKRPYAVWPSALLHLELHVAATPASQLYAIHAIIAGSVVLLPVAAGWAPEPVYTFWRREKSLSLVGNRTTIPRFFNGTLLYCSVYTMMHHELRVLIVSSLAIPVASFMGLSSLQSSHCTLSWVLCLWRFRNHNMLSMRIV